ncbi:hypothetical protein jhhlp_003332 [Lomentospora prolificans]|uniref:6-phosphogluconate dehydrogenase NADP-binding domain-containing protein n=1 Tax=Lomentospora prolificans TaxID=41688 RepID=A0A2N3NGN9_9PEZI|nr:hypothetical protein jhhlp_003332 [Lomentospora prolificans]
MAPRLMWIGLGNMGRGMCKNLVEKGSLAEPLIIYNRTRKRSEDLAATLSPSAVEIASSVEEGVAKADIIFTCIADDAAVQSTIAAAVSGDVTNKVFVDCSTIHPSTTEAMAASVTAKGAQFVAAPVFGAPAMADAGQLVCVLAGPREAVDSVRRYFKGVMGRAEIDLAGEPYAKASTLKVLGNTFILNMVEQLAEGLVVAEKSGLGTDAMVQFVEAVFPGPYAAYAHRMLSGDYHQREEPLFAVDLARKDLRHALSLAGEAGVRLRNAEVAGEHLGVVREYKGVKGDIAGIYGAVRLEAGLKYENENDFVILFVAVVVAALCIATYVFVPRFFPRETQLLLRSSVILALISCYLMWALTYLAQLHPLVAPKRSDLRREVH